MDGDDVPSNDNFTPIGRALAWLQRHTADSPPIIVAPRTRTGQAITRFVPNNDDETHIYPELHRVAKPTIPTLFLLDTGQKAELHYVWEIAGGMDCRIDDIERAARSLTTLGWGIDLAFADARLANESEVQQLNGVRWYPKKNAGLFHNSLRTPTYDDELGECTLRDLRHCHSTLIGRIDERGNSLKTVDKPRVFDRVLYTSTERLVGRPHAVFKLIDESDATVTYPQSKLVHIAGMVRHLAKEAMTRNPPSDLRGRKHSDWVESYVVGHRSKEGKDASAPHTQFSYVPLQSVGTPHTDPGVRRVMIIAPVGDDAWLEHLARHLDGALLRPLASTPLPPGTRLERVDDHHRADVRNAYLDPATTWASVTPVILPGHDDRKPAKTQSLILKALQQSGIEHLCTFEWSPFSQFHKMLPAHKYRKDHGDPAKRIRVNYVRPDHLLDQTAVHLKLAFANDLVVPGTLTIGAGRHYGFGVMVGLKD